MLNYIWAVMIAIGVIYGALTGNIEAVANGALDSAGEAVQPGQGVPVAGGHSGQQPVQLPAVLRPILFDCLRQRQHGPFLLSYQ